MPTYTPTKIWTYEYKSSKYPQSEDWLSFGYGLQSQVFFNCPRSSFVLNALHFVLSFFNVCSLCVHLIAMSVDLIFLYLMINSRTQFTLNSLVKDPQWFCSVNLSIHVLIFMNIKCINIHFSCLITLVVFHNHQFHRYM